MSIFTNSIFNVVTNQITVSGNNFNVTSGSNVINKLPLCNVKIGFNEYQRLSIIIPANYINFLLTFPTLNDSIIFLSLIPTYTSASIDAHTAYLNWKFVTSNDAMLVMTNMLTLTANYGNPIDDIYITNPSDCDIRIDVLVASGDSNTTYTPNTIFFGGLTYNNIITN